MDARRQLTAAAAIATLASTPTSALAGPEPRPGAPAKSSPAKLSTQDPAPAIAGRPAIVRANQAALARSEGHRFDGGVQVFAYAPGRVFEVWTAPLRVTAITFAPAETVVALAAGDTVRWQIGETASGEGPERRAHVLVKPLARDLSTNLVVTTSQRLYHLQLRSGGEAGANTRVTWDIATQPAPPRPPAPPPAPAAPPTPEGSEVAALDASYRIQARGRPPRWTPTAVMTDGRRTYIAFPPGLTAQEAPALFALDAGGRPELVNYRQLGRLYVADRVLDRAELRQGAHRQVVRLIRLPEPRT